MKKRIVIIILSLALVLVAVGMVAAVTSAGGIITGNFDEPSKIATVDQTLDVTGVPTVSADTHNGTITITRGDENKVFIHATKRAVSDDLLAKLQVNIRQDGNRITVETTGDTATGFALFGFNRTVVDYQIQVPTHTDLGPVKSSNGRIDVNGIAGQHDLTTANGLITVRDVDGTLKAETSNGRVTVMGGRGTLQLRSSNGTVEVHDVQSNGLDLHSSNGRVTFAGSIAPGSKNSVDTSNGTVSMSLPPESALNVDLQSGNGSVRVDFPVTTAPGSEPKRNKVQGVIGRPDADLTVHTGNGSITLTKQGI